jgi:hypothetical protein
MVAMTIPLRLFVRRLIVKTATVVRYSNPVEAKGLLRNEPSF